MRARVHPARSMPARLALCLAVCSMVTPIGLSGTLPALAIEQEGCLERAAAWAEVHPTLLRAIAWVESQGNPRALNWNRNGSYDVGLMQINSGWYSRGLKPWWRSLGQPCVNVAAAAWVLKQCVADYGYTWNAVGCYHAGPRWERGRTRAAGRRYIARVQQVVVQHRRAHLQKRALAIQIADGR